MEKSHIIWNKRHPNDRVKKGELIHHKNGDHDDDREENQEKMLFGKHISLHMKGKKTYKRSKKKNEFGKERK